MKIKLSIVDVIAVEFPARAKGAVCFGYSERFWPIWATFVVREPLCDPEAPPLCL